ncbi:tryptophan 7-halogenase [Colwellia sp. BRX10-3]|uniref:tryptophan halogenase family protein n=1 Tax=Colwellia sp. BRX10-3 TaxID=2759844 RepID=UPI0015F3764E|nr:tryptophan halogenase family protein [Colwellia sp. BRX10-3]MBA6391894.1 tryptophan 7-halogenase [Colwellia sp. BRX10-3]
MSKDKVTNVVIVGGGTAGWISAALLAKILGKAVKITLIESEKIGIVGVGEATIPPMINFNNALGINENDFLKATKATIKLGIQFENWKELGSSYMHAFGGVGKNFPFCDFHHFWVKSQQLGIASDFWDFSVNYQAATQNKFGKMPNLEGTNIPGITYAYHFDAGLYAKFLREYSEAKGVERIEGIIEDVELDNKTGNVKTLTLDNQQKVVGDVFIDCSGMRGILIEKALNTGYEDWSHWLPCDRAMAMPTTSTTPIKPFTRSIAHEAGWQWQIPLQHRTGNGIVYSSRYLDDESAKKILLANVDGEPLAEPKVIPFQTGRRRKQWNKNVVAIGLSSGFLEPLESTSIHLIQTAVIRLIKHFPHQGIKEEEINEFNRQSKIEIEKIRDFIILHYKLNQRGDSPFWRECQRMDIPESLATKMALFKSSGKVFRDYDDLFTEIAWQQVMIGQGLVPNDTHPLSDQLTKDQLEELFDNLKVLIQRSVDKLPTHEAFLNKI